MAGIRAEDVLEWREALRRWSPEAPDFPDLVSAPQVASASLAVAPSGVGLRLIAMKDGELLAIDVNVNAVAALSIANAILSEGRNAGWLSESGQIVVAAEGRSPDH